MKSRVIHTVLISSVSVLGLSGQAIAGHLSSYYGEGSYPSYSIFVPPAGQSVFVPPSVFGGAGQTTGEEATTAATDQIVEGLQAASKFCASIGEAAYRVDCLSERLEAAAREMPATGDYAEARAALLDAARKLNALARANADPDLPRANARQPRSDGIRTTRPLVPVNRAALQDVGIQAAAILQEAETILLRSAESSAGRKVHYTRIAAVVGSNKVLLRTL